jgi:hypothetical protein
MGISGKRVCTKIPEVPPINIAGKKTPPKNPLD